MFTTDSGYGWKANPSPMGTVWMGDHEVSLSSRGIEDLAARLAAGEGAEQAIGAVIRRDFGHEVVGFWHYTGKRNPWRMIGRVQVMRTIEYGRVRYTATSVITDHCSASLPHLLGRLARLQFGSAAADRRDRRKAKAKSRRREGSYGEVWARRAEEGWGPGGY